jgi:cytochrome c oxidase cbb3-type subunit III
MLARSVLIVSLLVMVCTAIAWFRGTPQFRPGPVAAARRIDLLSQNQIYPGGGAPPQSAGDSHAEANGFDVSEGQRLFRSFNCNGCHQNGGGGIGPALMDSRWIYGSEPRAIYTTIVEGRPNGMPSFRNKINDHQLWQLVAYVRSMSGLVPAAARSSREDHMQSKPPGTLQPTEPPVPGGDLPKSAERPQ